jgi:excisionase family DNA binding protein
MAEQKDPPPPTLKHVPRLLSRQRLRRRWRHGSDAFFWRAQRDGLLIPRRDGRRTGYDEDDVFAFEGGAPPKGMLEAYRADLLTPEEVAALCPLGRDAILARARRGELPARRVGNAWRFVPAEVARWLRSWD